MEVILHTERDRLHFHDLAVCDTGLLILVYNPLTALCTRILSTQVLYHILLYYVSIYRKQHSIRIYHI